MAEDKVLGLGWFFSTFLQEILTYYPSEGGKDGKEVLCYWGDIVDLDENFYHFSTKEAECY